MSKPKIPIIEVNHGIANRFGDSIEVNKHLIKYPKLYFPIIQHELSHIDNISKKDFEQDINSTHKIDQIQLLKFVFKHPKSLTQLLPFYYTKKRKFVYDINLVIVYSIMFLIGLGIYAWLF